jgi:hypothetical protein
MMGLSILTGAVALIVLLLPFFVGRGGALQAGSAVNSPDQLERIKQALLKRYLEDEQAFQDKRISRMVWQQRRQYLVNRYVDTARRLDYLKHSDQES